MVLEKCHIVSCWKGFRWCQEGVRLCQEVPRVYFKRLLARPEYILQGSWQEALVEHMEIKKLHVAILLSPICGPLHLTAYYIPFLTFDLAHLIAN